MFDNVMRPIFGGGAARLVMAWAAVILIGLSATMAQAQTLMTEDELLAVIPGASIQSKTDEGVAWAQNYSKANGKRKGSIKGIFDGTKYDAKWYVKDGLWCEDWGDGNECFGIERVDAKSLRIYRGEKARPNLWKLK